MFRNRSVVSAVVCALALCHCSDDKCKSEPTSFQLDLTIPGDTSRIRSLTVSLRISSVGFQRTYDVDPETVADGATSIAVELSPPPASGARINLAVSANTQRGQKGETVLEASNHFDLQPNGCNRFALTLAPVATDAGMSDGGEPSDTGAPDAEAEADANGLDADALDASVDAHSDADLDAGMSDSGFLDTGLVDAGLVDAAGVDAGTPISFMYAPTNFEPNALPLPRNAVLNCGISTFDSTSLTFGNWCGGEPPEVATVVQNGGQPVAIVSLLNLRIETGATLRIQGMRPIVLAVFGNATVSGILDASATLAGSGPGVAAAPCEGGTETAGTNASQGAGGGGGGGYGTAGGTGGDGSVGVKGAAGAANGNADLRPLRGGCIGGKGGDGQGVGGSGGFAGGAVQVSSAGTLTVSGSILANGAGGMGGVARNGGGGGGGSGGAILVEAEHLIFQSSARLLANGGGGGEGARDVGAQDGRPGSSGSATSAVPASGGTGGSVEGGDGGNGSAGNLPAGNGSPSSEAAGGGGGGGSGRIRVRTHGTCSASPSLLSSPQYTSDGC